MKRSQPLWGNFPAAFLEGMTEKRQKFNILFDNSC